MPQATRNSRSAGSERTKRSKVTMLGHALGVERGRHGELVEVGEHARSGRTAERTLGHRRRRPTPARRGRRHRRPAPGRRRPTPPGQDHGSNPRRDGVEGRGLHAVVGGQARPRPPGARPAARSTASSRVGWSLAGLGVAHGEPRVAVLPARALADHLAGARPGRGGTRPPRCPGRSGPARCRRRSAKWGVPAGASPAV